MIVDVVYLMPDYEVYILFFIGLIFGLAPLIFIVMRCREALTMIRLQFFGGTCIADASNSKEVDLIRARPYGSDGQYIAGKDRFRQRSIFVDPKGKDHPFTARFILKGMRRPIYFNFSGSTALATPEHLAAIEVAESAKKDLPQEIRQWAEANNIETTEYEDVEDSDGRPMRKAVSEVVQLFLLDPRKIKTYFAKFYRPDQFDVLLEQKYEQGRNSRGGGFKLPAGLIIIIVIAVMGIIGLLLAMKLGWIK